MMGREMTQKLIEAVSIPEATTEAVLLQLQYSFWSSL